MTAAIQGTPRDVGINLGDWQWQVVRQDVRERVRVTLGRRRCRNSLHRLGCVLQRPKKRRLQANPERRAICVPEDARLCATAAATGAKLCCVDAAHFCADVDRRGQWVLKGEPALVGSTRPRSGEQASYSSAVCLETGQVAALELAGNRCAETAVTCLQPWRANQAEPLLSSWDNGPAHGGEARRTDLTTPDGRRRRIRRPADSPDFTPDAAIRGWIRDAVTATSGCGTRATVQRHVGQFVRDIAQRTDAVERRCRPTLHEPADALAPIIHAILHQPDHVDPTVALV